MTLLNHQVLDRAMKVEIKTYLCIRDKVDQTFIPVMHKVGDIILDRIDRNGESFVEIPKNLVKELKKIQTKLRNIDKEQERLYSKESYHTNPRAWKVSQKLDGLAQEERYWRKRYAEMVLNATGKEIDLHYTPCVGARSMINY